jgi:hypothetical protein
MLDGVARGAPAKDLRDQLGHLLWEDQPTPAALLVTDPAQYFWALQCMHGHLRLLTVQAAKRQVEDSKHLGQLSACERCPCAYRVQGPAPLPDELHRSYCEQVAWLQLERVLKSDNIQRHMSAKGSSLHGQELGYVVEVKIMRGTFGKVDIYVPLIDLIIQVDGKHHNLPAQLQRDARFNAEAVVQRRHVLRLYYKDVPHFHSAIINAFHQCMHSNVAWAKCSVQHPAKEVPFLLATL